MKGEEIAEWLENEKDLGIEGMDGEDPPDDPGNKLWIQYIDYLAAVARQRDKDEDPTTASPEPPTKEALVKFLRWLGSNTDTFDYVMIEVLLESNNPGHPHCPVEHPRDLLGFNTDEDMSIVDDFLESEFGVRRPCTTCGQVDCDHPLRSI